jgi:uncharacterized protein (TIGR02453 family)
MAARLSPFRVVTQQLEQETYIMNTQQIFNYLSQLSENNNREWYHLHKAEYVEANAQFEALIQELILQLGKTDGTILHNIPKDLTFKLVRDTRFSHDKSPYNPAFRAHISAMGKLPVPVGYYLMLKPGNQSFLGGGLFADMFKDATKMVRDYIVQNSDEWDKIIQDTEFKKYFTVHGTSLKNVPSGYDKEHPQAEFLKMKSWYLEYPVEDKIWLDIDTFLPQMVRIYEAMKPFNDYLNKALAGFQMPSR